MQNCQDSSENRLLTVVLGRLGHDKSVVEITSSCVAGTSSIGGQCDIDYVLMQKVSPRATPPWGGPSGPPIPCAVPGLLRDRLQKRVAVADGVTRDVELHSDPLDDLVGRPAPDDLVEVVPAVEIRLDQQ